MRIVNRRAYYDYVIKEKIEAGIVLTGGEVKSIRAGRIDLSNAHVMVREDGAVLVNAFIPPYEYAHSTGYEPRHSRQLLLHKRQLHTLLGRQQQKGLAVVPTAAYISHNLVKIELGIGRGKRKHEKREALRRKTIERDIEQALRGKT